MKRGVYLVVGIAVCFMTGSMADGNQDNSAEVSIQTTCRHPGIENGAYQLFYGGTVVHYRCNTGYTLHGKNGNTRTCQQNLQWDGSAPVCSAPGCSEAPPTVSDAAVDRFNRDTVREYRCHAGYELQGSPFIYCDGTRWRNEPPHCVRQRAVERSPQICSEPPRVENTVMVRAGRMVSYSCASGFQQRLGTKTIRCGEDGQWIGSPAVCIRPGCDVPGTYDVGHGTVSLRQSRSVVKVTCFNEYELVGSRVLFCNGERWNASLPICQLLSNYPTIIRDGTRCGHIPRVANSQTNYETKQDAGGSDFHAVIYTCDRGYTVNPADYAVYCSGGNVVGTPPNCISHCGYRNGRCSHICRNTEDGSVCSCRDGYKLESDGETCRDIDECATNQRRGACQFQCSNHDGGFICHCPSGYSLASDGTSCLRNEGQCNCGTNGHCVTAYGNSHRCQCFNGYQQSSDGLSCLEVKRQCRCGIGTASCTENNGVKMCTCRRGYRTSDDGTTCVDIDECVESPNGHADCQVACQNTAGSYRCYCPGEWRRLASDFRTCIENTCNCGRGSIACSQPNGLKTCTCAAGYKLGYNGESCIDRNECQEYASGRGPCQGTCINNQGSYRCSCTEAGYQLAGDRHSCEDIDECQYPSGPRRCQHACINVPGSYRCGCPAGYLLMPDGISCEGCRPNSYRSATANECVECPAHSRTDGRAKASIEDCLCLPGYSGDLSRRMLCKDNNECEDDNGGCQHHCINTPGSFYCACPDGFNLLDDRTTCTDHDECTQSNGGCQHNCLNNEGSFLCTCNEGYYVDPNDPYLCLDVNECEIEGNGCQQMCINFPGGFHCQCDDSSLLAPDGKTCNPVTCSPLILPEKMKVSPRDRCLGNHETNQITVGTTCSTACQRGYELHGPSSRTCLNTGQWSDQPASCKPVRCPALQHPTNGQVRPISCLLENENEFRGSCVFLCDDGFSVVGATLTNCQASGEWSRENPTCKEVSEITCPKDMSVVLEQGASEVVVNLTEPVHTLDHLESSVPLVGHSFGPGRTTVTYTAWSNTTGSTTSCSFTVTVIDVEPPVFTFCPKSFTVKTAVQYPQVVWDEPVVSDNVGVTENINRISPEGRFTWGTYTVLVYAYDASGNTATCQFSISIQTMECGKPNGPLNGESSCTDWMFGKICEPRCNQSHFFFDGPPTSVYLCGFDGAWSPSYEVPDCSPYVFLGNKSRCPFGSEMKSYDALGEPACIACPRGMYSAVTNSTVSCLPCPVGTYQDEFSQGLCKSCPSGQTTSSLSAKKINECFGNYALPTTETATATAKVTANMTTTNIPHNIEIVDDIN